ncbi:MAG: glycosyltransferase [Burkholderiaceae bacterium]
MKMNDLHPALNRCLWICREMTDPLVSGDRVYSSGLSRALARSGVEVSFVAHQGENRQPDPDGHPVKFFGVEGGTYNDYRIAVTSDLPVTAGIQGTPAFHKQLARLLEEQRFDCIVLDQLGSGWALAPVRKWIDTERAKGNTVPMVIYLAHNHETAVWAGMAKESQRGPLRNLMVRRNADKVARLESRLVKESDLVLTITEEDAGAFADMGAVIRPTVLTPGYSGPRVESRNITAATPRRIVMVGSFKWAPKEENLRQFLKVADGAFKSAGIHFDVIGKVPDSLRSALEPGLQATTLHGFVQDIEPIFANARMAVIPELIGGGFKLKLLDYLFGRLPMASIGAAAAGMPDPIREQMILADDLQSLVDAIIANIDNVERLQQMQQKGYLLAEAAYSWDERGVEMKAAIESALNIALVP